ncbi:MAG: hypothetical protein CVU39_03915 [Chloroflexi bacterium HGW-Chloroflexi-10]|nr:MAG: hypothetical protein CVU39_03915 [Chloroflexi bacterium HGW-Chloroflexi-10]
MNKAEFQLSLSNGTNLFAQKWLTSEKPKAIITLVHGLGEHCDRYDHVAQFFNDAGISFYSYDHYGHGKSEGKRGHIPSYKVVTDSINAIIQFAKLEFPDTPVFLYGHSMGGNFVLYYLLQGFSEVTGGIVSSPGIGTGEPVPPGKLIFGKIMRAISPNFTMKNGLDVENLSHDKSVIEAYKKDPLVHPMISARLGVDMIEKGPWIIKNASMLKNKLLLLQGTGDHIVSPSLTKEFASNAPQNLLTFKLYDGYFHEIHNEVGKKQVLEDIVSWIHQQTINPTNNK